MTIMPIVIRPSVARTRSWRAAWALPLLLPVLACAAEVGSGEAAPLPTVTVVATGTSNMDAASVGDVGQDAIASQPLLRPGAVLENVPGLIVTQHSGEGKANQYFLRAFNLDHGTDLATEVDEMPVNMPTHAHGQGYTDLNFLIPELVSDLHYKKGPYYADQGDFATAGAVRMDLLNEVPDSVSLGYGEDGYRRALLLGSAGLGQGTLLAALDLYHNDGPFEYPDDYGRTNAVLRYHRGSTDDFFTVTAMTYSGRWNSTDQVPQHAITDGIIGRYGSLNPSDGGESIRSSLSFNRVLRTDSDQVELSAYVIRYRLDLWSDFTYYLKDPVNGDQMLQHDDRVVYGFNASKTWFGTLWGMPTPICSACSPASMTSAMSPSPQRSTGRPCTRNRTQGWWRPTLRLTSRTAPRGRQSCARYLGCARMGSASMSRTRWWPRMAAAASRPTRLAAIRVTSAPGS